MFLSNSACGPKLPHFSCRPLLECVKSNQWMEVFQPLMCIQTKATSEQTLTTRTVRTVGFIANSFPLQIHFYSTPRHINAKTTLMNRLKPQIKIRHILLDWRWAQIFLGVLKMQSWFICKFSCNWPRDFELLKGNQKVGTNWPTRHTAFIVSSESNTNDWKKWNTENLFSTSCS